MKYQKSPLPYLSLLIAILSVAVYSTSTIDKQIDQPLVYTIDNAPENEFLVDTIEDEELVNHSTFIASVSK